MTTPGQARPPHLRPGLVALVFAGGALGTLMRFGAEELDTGGVDAWPWATFATNLVGSAILGGLLAAVLRRPDAGRTLQARMLVGVGFCGGLTTYSSFVLEVDERWRDGHLALGVSYLVATVVACILCAAAGHTLVDGLFHRNPGTGRTTPGSAR